MNSMTRTFGVTSPMTFDSPTESEIQLTKGLVDYLKTSGMFEADKQIRHRSNVVKKLSKLFKEWVKDVCLKKYIPPYIVESMGGKVCPFGSFRLNVAGNNSDIDALCIAPRHIEREDFFNSFYKKLKKRSEVTEIKAVENAYVPLIKLNFSGVEVDLLFAKLTISPIPEDVDLLDDKILKNLDIKCVRSLNGLRNTEEILNQIPNHETFKLAARAIKLWAKRQGIYSNVLGYLGGISWAMMVARICQLYPNAAASTIIEKFFKIFIQWTWPGPMLLKKHYDAKHNFRIWDPRIHYVDRCHLMPIITPVYPQMNSTFNVTRSTMKIITEALEAGRVVTQDMKNGKSRWETFFTAPDFFKKYKSYLTVVAVEDTEEDLVIWGSYVESKIRFLISSLEEVRVKVQIEKSEELEMKPALKRIQINPMSFKIQGNDFKDNSNIAWILGLEFEKTTDNINLTEFISKFVKSVYEKGQHMKQGDVNCRYLKRKELSEYLPKEVLDESVASSLKKNFGSEKRKSGSTSSELQMAKFDGI